MAPSTTSRGTATRGRGQLVTRQLRAPLSALSFWSAIALPVFYLPLFATGIETSTDLLVFVGLCGLHVLALVGGHNYHSNLATASRNSDQE